MGLDRAVTYILTMLNCQLDVVLLLALKRQRQRDNSNKMKAPETWMASSLKLYRTLVILVACTVFVFVTKKGQIVAVILKFDLLLLNGGARV